MTSGFDQSLYDKRVPPPSSYQYPMFDKVEINGAGAHELFEYLRRETLDGGDVSWNYHKWLVDGATGKVLEHYNPNVSPLAAEPRIRSLIGLKPECEGCA